MPDQVRHGMVGYLGVFWFLKFGIFLVIVIGLLGFVSGLDISD
jgi:hypothetical protein